jgi:hypothetical protein
MEIGDETRVGACRRPRHGATGFAGILLMLPDSREGIF